MLLLILPHVLQPKRDGLAGPCLDTLTFDSLSTGPESHLQVKVKEEFKVWHVPGFKEGIDMAGMEGVVQKDVTMYNGVKLSPNLPWKVQFEVEGKNGKAKKFFVHMVRLFSELQQHIGTAAV